jgi:hypothetical protein
MSSAAPVDSTPASATQSSPVESQLQPIVSAAAGSSQVLATAASVQIPIQPLPQGELGVENPGNIDLDSVSQGYVDPTANGSSASTADSSDVSLQAAVLATVDRVDLPTVVDREPGQIAGFDDLAATDELVPITLGPGMRRQSSLEPDAVDAFFAVA